MLILYLACARYWADDSDSDFDSTMQIYGTTDFNRKAISIDLKSKETKRKHDSLFKEPDEYMIFCFTRALNLIV